MKTASLAIATVLLLAACKGEDPQVAAQAAAAQAAAKEQAAEAMAKQFDDAVVAQNWTLAKAHGEILQIEHPTSAAAACSNHHRAAPGPYALCSPSPHRTFARIGLNPLRIDAAPALPAPAAIAPLTPRKSSIRPISTPISW